MLAAQALLYRGAMKRLWFMAPAVCIAALTSTDPARADHSVGMADMSDMGPTTGHPMSPGVVVSGGMVPRPWSLAAMMGYMSMNDRVILAGGEPVHNTHDMEMARTMLGLSLGLPWDFQLVTSMALIDSRATGTMHAPAANDEGGRGFRFSGKAVAQSDLSVLLKRRFLIGPAMTGAHISLLGAVEFPTGQDDGRFDEINIATSGYYPASDPGRLPLRMQPGSGSFDFTGGLAYSQLLGPVTIHSNVSYKRNTPGFDDVKLGDRFTYGFALAIHIVAGLSLSAEAVLRADADDEYPNANVDSLVTQKSNNPMAPKLQRGVLRGPTQNDPMLFTAPGLTYTLGTRARLSGALLIPTVWGDNGIIPNPTFILRAAVNITSVEKKPMKKPTKMPKEKPEEDHTHDDLELPHTH